MSGHEPEHARPGTRSCSRRLERGAGQERASARGAHAARVHRARGAGIGRRSIACSSAPTRSRSRMLGGVLASRCRSSVRQRWRPDDTPMLPVIVHAIDALARHGWSPDIVVLLQPTSPLRRPEHIRDAVDDVRETDADSVVTVVEVPRHLSPDYVMRIEEGTAQALSAGGRARDAASGCPARLLARRNGVRVLASTTLSASAASTASVSAADLEPADSLSASTRARLGPRPSERASGTAATAIMNVRRTGPRSVAAHRRPARSWRGGKQHGAPATISAGMVAGGEPIVAGPWLGEVGFELLYWVPFLRWFAERSTSTRAAVHRDVPGRHGVLVSAVCVAVSRRLRRGHADDVSASSHDARVRGSSASRSRRVSRVRQARSAAASGARRAQLVDAASVEHVSRLLNPYWWGHQSSDWVHRPRAVRAACRCASACRHA